MSNFIKKFVDSFLKALYPDDIKCIFCDKDVPKGSYICNNCLKEDFFNDNNTRCMVCDKPIIENNVICDHCKMTKHSFTKLTSPFIYKDKVRQSILKFKSDGAKYLAKPFARFIVDRLNTEKIDFDIIVPVPSHPKSIKKRGYNQARLLADEISAMTGKPVKDVLSKVTLTQNQKYLNYKERQKNLANSIVLNDKTAIKNKKILIVDDIITTGATIEICAELLKGASKIYGCSVARTIT